MGRTASAVAAALTLAAGCYTVDKASSAALRSSRLLETDGRPIEHVMVSNYGWYLFNRWPIVCGNVKPDAKLPWAFFSDEVTTDVVHDGITSYAAGRKANVADLNFIFNDSVLFEVPGTSIPIPMPYVLTYRERTVSGVLTEPPAASDAKRVRQRQLKAEMDSLLRRLPKEDRK